MSKRKILLLLFTLLSASALFFMASRSYAQQQTNDQTNTAPKGVDKAKLQEARNLKHDRVTQDMKRRMDLIKKRKDASKNYRAARAAALSKKLAAENKTQGGAK
jgi:hypothetical protein